MNKDQVKGKAKEIAGKVQQQVGRVTGSTSQQAKGLGKQVEGRVQKGMGDARDALEEGDEQVREAERKTR